MLNIKDGESIEKKFYRVEITYCGFLGIKSENSFIEYLEKKPEPTTEHFSMKDVHKTWFEDPVEAEDYRQKCLYELP